MSQKDKPGQPQAEEQQPQPPTYKHIPFKSVPKLPHARDPLNKADPRKFLEENGLQQTGGHRPGK